MKKILAVAGVLALALAFGACLQSPTTSTNQTTSFAHSTNGSAGQMPAYYDGELFIVNMKELSETTSENLEKNPIVAEIYTTIDLDEEQEFFPVIDVIQGEDGFSPLWEQIMIVFNPGFTPHQFFDEEEVEAAAEGANPEITLVDTEEVYRCSVVRKSQSQ